MATLYLEQYKSSERFQSQWEIRGYKVPQVLPLIEKLYPGDIHRTSKLANADTNVEDDYLHFFLERGWRVEKEITGKVTETTTGRLLPPTGFERYTFGLLSPDKIVTDIADRGIQLRRKIIREYSEGKYKVLLHTLQGIKNTNVDFRCWNTASELLAGLLARLRAEGRAGRSEEFHNMTKRLYCNHPPISYYYSATTNEFFQSIPIPTRVLRDNSPTHEPTAVTLSAEQLAGHDLMAVLGVLGLPWVRARNSYIREITDAPRW